MSDSDAFKLELQEVVSQCHPGKNFALSETFDGVLLGQLPGLVDYALFKPILERRDRILSTTQRGVEFSRSTSIPPTVSIPDEIDAAMLGANSMMRDTSGPIHILRFHNPRTDSFVIETMMARSDILKIRVGEGSIEVFQIIPSDLKGGLAHEKRRGNIGKNGTRVHARKKPRPWKEDSVALQTAKKKRDERSRWKWLSF